MKVYTVVHHLDYTGSFVSEIFATRELAREFLEKQIRIMSINLRPNHWTKIDDDNYRGSGENRVVEEWAVLTELPEDE